MKISSFRLFFIFIFASTFIHVLPVAASNRLPEWVRLELANRHEIPLEIAFADRSKLTEEERYIFSMRYGVPFDYFVPDPADEEPGSAGKEPIGPDMSGPTIQSISPNSGPIAGGTSVGLFGFDFQPGATVTFGGVAGTPVTVSNCSTLNVITPARATAGQVDVVLTNPDGGTATLARGFTYFVPGSGPAITVSGISPNAGSTAGGTGVVITGSGFNLLTNPFIGIGSLGATNVRVVNDTTIVATTAASVPGSFPVSLSIGGFSANGGRFVFTGPLPAGPTLTSFTPAQLNPGAVEITIQGTNLDSVRDVYIGTTRLTATITVLSPTMIRASALFFTGRSGPVTVVSPFGSSRSCTNLIVPAFAVGPPTIVDFRPVSVTEGGSFVILGSNFVGVSEIRIGGARATSFFIRSPTELVVFVQEGTPGGLISVTTPAGTATSAGSVTITPRPVCTGVAPTIASFTPGSGNVGTVVTITGTDFRGGGAGGGTGSTRVIFSAGVSAFPSVSSATQLTVTVPAGAVTGPITVITDYGRATSASSFTVTTPTVPPPAVTSMTPSTGNPDSNVTFNGTDLRQVTGVSFNGEIVTAFPFSDLSFSVSLPIAATTGPVLLIYPGGTVAAPAFTVTCAAPTLTSVTPPSGRAGFTLALSGTNLSNSMSGASTATLRFGGGVSSSFSASGTAITTSVPTGAITGPIVYSNPYGTASLPSFTVTTFTPAPSITFFEPLTGSRGTSVLIFGNEFIDVRSVQFNGTTATFVSSTSQALSAVVPAGATTGPITITTGTGAVTSGAAFTVTFAVPVITGFARSVDLPGSRVSIVGTNFAGATAVQFNGVASGAFTVESNDVIRASVPASATSGVITVITPNGTATSATSFVVLPLTNLSLGGSSPSSGTIQGGTRANLSGFDFAPGASVTFGGVPALSVTFNSCTSLSVVTPPRAAGFADIVVTNVDGRTSTAVGGFNYLATPATIDAILPPSAPSSGGTTIVISGSGFVSRPTRVFLGSGVEATDVRLTSPGTITAVIPPHMPGGAIVSVSFADGQSASTNFIFTAPVPPRPVITGFTPASGPAGSTVTITGTDLGGARSVNFGGGSGSGSASGLASIVSNSSTQIVVTLSQGTSSGPILVTTFAGQARSCARFTVTPAGAPTITSFTPATGGPFIKVIVTGTNFVEVQRVTVGAIPVSFFSADSDTSIRFFTARGTLTGPITVTTASGAVTSAGTFTATQGGFCTGPPPVITSFTPSTGTPGTVVTIQGNFLAPNLGVQFGTSRLVNASGTASTITATVPADATTGTVSVYTDFGVAVSGPGFTVTPQTPTVTAISPTSGETGVTRVTIDGTNLTSVTSITFAGGVTVSGPFGATASLLSLNVPFSAMTGPIVLNSLAGSVATPVFTVTCGLAPTITGITPTSGTVSSNVTITGTNLYPDVRLNGLQLVGSTFTPTSMTLFLPAESTSGSFVVMNPAGPSATSPPFTVLAGGPVITSFTPASAAPGDVVAIVGSNLQAASDVRFNGTSATGVTVVDGRAVLATVPPAATSGQISLTSPTGTSFSPAFFTLGGTVPTVTGFSPRAFLPGSVVTISGTNFRGIVTVSFNGTPSSAVTVLTPYALSATVPAGATAGTITVTSGGVTATSTALFGIAPPPVISSIFPAIGPLDTNVPVTISGTGFQAGLILLFGGISASDVVVVSSTTVTARTPARSSPGPVEIEIINPDDQRAKLGSAFNYGATLPSGDANADGRVSVADIFYLINNLFAGGPAPVGPADPDGSGGTSVADVFYLINFLFVGGPSPR